MDRLHHDTPKKWTGISLRVSLHNPLKKLLLPLRYFFAWDSSFRLLFGKGFGLASPPDTQSNIARK